MGTSPAARRARLRLKWQTWRITQIPCPARAVCAERPGGCDHGVRAQRAGRSLSAPTAEALEVLLIEIDSKRSGVSRWNAR